MRVRSVQGFAEPGRQSAWGVVRSAPQPPRPPIRKAGKMDHRGSDGRFQPGVSGNPGGRPRVAAAARDLARYYLVDALRVLGAIVQSPDKHPSGVVVLAARELLDRSVGRPGFGAPIKDDGAPLIDLAYLSDDELAAAIDRAQADELAQASAPALPSPDDWPSNSPRPGVIWGEAGEPAYPADVLPAAGTGSEPE